MLAGGDLLAGDLLDRRIKAGTVSPARSPRRPQASGADLK